MQPSRVIVRTLIPAVGLILLYLAVQSFVQAFRNPSRMDFLKSLTTDMAVHTPPGSMPVQIETVGRGAIGEVVTYTGLADAYNDVAVYPRVQGWIVSTPVYSGDVVRKGQLLARLDSTELSARLEEAKSAQEAAQNSYLAAKKAREEALAHKKHFSYAIREAKANLDYWEKEVKREEALLRRNVISQEEYDRELAQYEGAKSRYEQAQSQCHAAEMAAEAAEYRLKEAESLLAKASASALTQQIIRDYTQVLSPVNGVVTDRKLDLGILAKPENELMRVAQIDPIRIQASVALADIQAIAVGTPVRIWTDKHKSGRPTPAKVTAIFKQAELPTRTVTVEALVPNSEGRILPGDFVTVDFQRRTKRDVVIVSNSAIVDKDQQRAVWMAENGRARLRYVTTGISDGEKLEIVAGLKSGDTVITRGHTYLKDGDLIAAARFTKEGLVELPPPPASNRFEKANNYTVRQALEHYVLVAQLNTSPPIQGVNEIEVELLPVHGSVPDNISLQVNSLMPAMPRMTVPRPVISKVGPGRFKIKVEHIMVGLWQLTMTVREGGQVVDTTELFLELVG